MSKTVQLFENIQCEHFKPLTLNLQNIQYGELFPFIFSVTFYIGCLGSVTHNKDH